MSKHDVVNRVVSYRIPEAAEMQCGLVIGVEGDRARLFEYVRVADPSDHISEVERQLGEENALICGYQEKLQAMGSAAGSPRSVASDEGSTLRLHEKWLRWAKDSLRRLGDSELRQVAASPSPPAERDDADDDDDEGGGGGSGAVGRLVSEAVAAVVLGTAGRPTAAEVESVFGDSLVERLCALDAAPVSDVVYATVMETFYTNRRFTYQEAAACSPAAGALYKWLTAFMDSQRARLPSSADAESRELRAACEEGVRLAEARRDRLQEDLVLTRQGMLFRRTNRIKVIPHVAIAKVVVDAPARLGRQFVVKGLDGDDDADALTIVRRTPPTASLEPPIAGQRCRRRSSQKSGYGSEFGGSLAAMTASRSQRTRSISSLTAASSSAVASEARVSTAPAVAAPATVTAPSRRSSAAPGPLSSPPVPSSLDSSVRLQDEHAQLRAENAQLRRQLDTAAAASQKLQEQSRALLLSLRGELYRVQESHRGLLDDLHDLEAQHEGLQRQTEWLVEQRAREEQDWANACARLDKQLHIARALIDAMRAAGYDGGHRNHANGAANGSSGGSAKTAVLEEVGGGGGRGPAVSTRLLEPAPEYMQELLSSTTEFLRGAMAAMELPAAY